MRIAVAADPARARASVRVWGDRLAGRVVRADAHGAVVALVATEAILLGGDDVRIDVEVGPGAWLDVVEVTGTVAYDGDGRPCTWEVDASVGPGGLLTWHGEPFVVSAGSLVTRTTTVRLAVGGVSCVRESLVLGRQGSPPGGITSTTSVTVEEVPLLVETLDLPSPAGMANAPDQVIARPPGLIGTARVIDTVLLAGVRTAAEPSPEVFQLAGPGTMFRSLTADLHESMLSPSWEDTITAAREFWDEGRRRREQDLEAVSRSPGRRAS